MIAKMWRRRASGSNPNHNSNLPKNHAIPRGTTTARKIAAYLPTPATQRIFAVVIAWGGIGLYGILGIQPAQAQDAVTKYTHMAPLKEYLMDRDAEIALARSAAPEAISRDATVLVLRPKGFETAVKGSNGFVCMVQRVGSGAIDWPEFWNPKIRAAECLNPIAARTMVPIYEMKTRLVLAGYTPEDIYNKIEAAFSRSKIPALEPGAMSYMMSKNSYLTDDGSHDMAHVMFYVPIADAGTWGANRPNSPIGSANYWFNSPGLSQKFKDLPTIRVFTVKVPAWSDGTPADHTHDG
jgi:hypothetical protein